MKAIIFDLDNTLIDFMQMKKAACEAAVDAMIKSGLRMPKKKALHEIYRIYKKYGIEEHRIFQKFLEKTAGNIDYRRLAHAIVAYREARKGYLQPYRGVRETLKSLKNRGFRLAVVSDAPKLKAWIRLVSMGIDSYFDAVVGFEDTGRKKPSVYPYKKALGALKVSAADSLMVGDRPSIDLKGAKKLGIRTCYAKYGGTVDKKFKADFEIGKFSELLGLSKVL